MKMDETKWSEYEWLEYNLVGKHGLSVLLRKWRESHNIG